jgi:4-hydroxybenzoate polyprenyltransferase
MKIEMAPGQLLPAQAKPNFLGATFLCIAIARPKQWTKNLVCFAGLLFAGKALDANALLNASLGFAAYCFASSFAYVINDMLDREKDRKHPTKRFRPIASGDLTLSQAWMMAALCLSGAFGCAFPLGSSVAILLAIYMMLHLAYSLKVKNIVLLDVMFISGGFILRILVGTCAVGVPTSAWILLCTFFLSLFLGFGKRRAEINSWKEEAINFREVLREYNVTMLDRFCNISATLAIASYALFTVTSRPDHSLIVTCPPVVFGLWRYLLLIEARNQGEAPETVLIKDRPLQAAILVWLALCILVLYGRLRLNII